MKFKGGIGLDLSAGTLFIRPLCNAAQTNGETQQLPTVSINRPELHTVMICAIWVRA